MEEALWRCFFWYIVWTSLHAVQRHPTSPSRNVSQKRMSFNTNCTLSSIMLEVLRCRFFCTPYGRRFSRWTKTWMNSRRGKINIWFMSNAYVLLSLWLSYENDCRRNYNFLSNKGPRSDVHQMATAHACVSVTMLTSQWRRSYQQCQYLSYFSRVFGT